MAPLAEKASHGLERAAALIERGWHKGLYAVDRHGEPCTFKDGVAWCAVGAIKMASDSLPVARHAEELLTDTLAASTSHRGIVSYNDHVAERASDVSGVMRHAAARDCGSAWPRALATVFPACT